MARIHLLTDENIKNFRVVRLVKAKNIFFINSFCLVYLFLLHILRHCPAVKIVKQNFQSFKLFFISKLELRFFAFILRLSINGRHEVRMSFTSFALIFGFWVYCSKKVILVGCQGRIIHWRLLDKIERTFIDWFHSTFRLTSHSHLIVLYEIDFLLCF